MVRIWYTEDPEPDVNGETGYQTVHYQNPYLTEKDHEARLRLSHKRQIEEEELRSDPMKRYYTDRKNEIRRRVAQLSKDPKYYGMSQNHLRRYVASNMGNHDEPVIISKHKRERDESSEPRRGGGNGSRRLEQNAEDGNLSIKRFDRAFIDRIKSTRVARELSQEDLAKMINRNKNEIRDFENGTLAFDGSLKSVLIWKFGLS